MRSKSKHWDQDERSERASPEKADHSEQANQTPSQGACAWCARCVFFCARRASLNGSCGATRARSLWLIENHVLCGTRIDRSIAQLDKYSGFVLKNQDCLPKSKMMHNERARVAPQDSFKDALCAQKKTQRAHHAHAPWLGVWCLVRLLAVVGFFWARSLAPLVLILVLAL